MRATDSWGHCVVKRFRTIFQSYIVMTTSPVDVVSIQDEQARGKDRRERQKHIPLCVKLVLKERKIIRSMDYSGRRKEKESENLVDD